MVLALAFYFVLLGDRGIALVRDGRPVSVVFGIAVLVLPILGIWIVYATLRAGFAHQHLAHRAHDEDLELDVTDLPKMPSGRVERDAADALFAQVKSEWETDPDNWRSSYRLARAYDYAGDRSRARDTMRRAVELERAERRARGT
ncbi:hypothetical protein HCA44_01555 [Rhodococcus sp. HNM0569]|nr:hypothetical protein [Rhodococcus sp. HNM0569]NLU81464.1 hypothetical protein [Rhodococcus sp. HNM0569]